MNAAMAPATARRVLLQLRQDPRTVVLMIVVPALLMVLLRYVFDSATFFSGIAPALLGFFPFLTMFLVTSVTMLRERTSGTLERLMTTPAAKFSSTPGKTGSSSWLPRSRTPPLGAPVDPMSARPCRRL